MQIEHGEMTTENQELSNEVRVFVVEDNPDHAFIALTVVKQVLGEDAEVILAESAEEATELINYFTEEDRPDLILVDLRLPRNGGFSVLSAVREKPSLARVPLLVITSSIFDRDIAQSYELGALAVLCKPLSRAKLREELARIGALTGAKRSALEPR
jgi:CheY-like chemotaxis protein